MWLCQFIKGHQWFKVHLNYQQKEVAPAEDSLQDYEAYVYQEQCGKPQTPLDMDTARRPEKWPTLGRLACRLFSRRRGYPQLFRFACLRQWGGHFPEWLTDPSTGTWGRLGGWGRLLGFYKINKRIYVNYITFTQEVKPTFHFLIYGNMFYHWLTLSLFAFAFLYSSFTIGRHFNHPPIWSVKSRLHFRKSWNGESLMRDT